MLCLALSLLACVNIYIVCRRLAVYGVENNTLEGCCTFNLQMSTLQLSVKISLILTIVFV